MLLRWIVTTTACRIANSGTAATWIARTITASARWLNRPSLKMRKNTNESAKN